MHFDKWILYGAVTGGICTKVHIFNAKLIPRADSGVHIEHPPEEHQILIGSTSLSFTPPFLAPQECQLPLIGFRLVLAPPSLRRELPVVFRLTLILNEGCTHTLG